MGLVLSRKPGEAITIGDLVTITVSELHKGRVCLYIDAPDDVLVLRAELQPPRARLAEAQGPR